MAGGACFTEVRVLPRCGAASRPTQPWQTITHLRTARAADSIDRHTQEPGFLQRTIRARKWPSRTGSFWTRELTASCAVPAALHLQVHSCRRLCGCEQRELPACEQLSEASIEADEVLAHVRHGCRQPGVGHLVAAQLFVEAELPQL